MDIFDNWYRRALRLRWQRQPTEPPQKLTQVVVPYLDAAGKIGPDALDQLNATEVAVGRWPLAFLLAIACQSVSFLFYSYHFWQAPPTRFGETFAILCRDPFTHAAVDTPQARHRLLGPLIAYATGLRGESGQAILVVATTIFLARMYILLRSRWRGEVSFLLTLLVATTPVVVTSQTWPGYPDILANLAVLECLAARSPWVVGPVMFLGMLGDERCIAAAPLVAIWHAVIGSDRRPVQAFVSRGAVSVAALLAWLCFYRWIQAEYVSGMPGYSNTEFFQAHLSGQMIIHGMNYIPGALYYALRQAWVLPMLGLVHAVARGPRLAGLLTAVAVGLAMTPGFIVGDHSRCMAMCWPIVLIATVQVEKAKPASFRDLVFACVVVNLLTPMYEVFSSGFYLRVPLPVSLLRLLAPS